jgi:hypothetical protein
MHRTLCNIYAAEATERLKVDGSPPAVAVYPPLDFPVFVSSHLTILFTGMLVVINCLVTGTLV